MQTPRDVSFCSHTTKEDEFLEIGDASTDPRFADNPLVVGDPRIRFYAGATLRLSSGVPIGTLCVIDQQPRQLTNKQRKFLLQLSRAVVYALESRRVTRDLAASEAKFRALVSASPLGIFRTDANGACTYANDRLLAIFNLGESEVIGHGWTSTLHRDDKEAVISELKVASLSQREFDMEFRIQHFSGKVVTVRAVSRPILTDDGAVCEHIGSVEDVTERLVVQRVLSEERRRLKSILEGTSAATWEWNIQTGEISFNDRWADMLGMTLEELTPSTVQTWHKLAHPEDLLSTARLLDLHLAGELDVYDCEYRLRHRNGRWIWVHLRGRLLTRLADGRPEWMFGTQLAWTIHEATRFFHQTLFL